MDGGAWWAAAHGVAKSRIRLTDFTFTCMHWRRKWQPTPVFLPGESWDGGAWWAAVYGVAQSRPRLKQLRSSSSSTIVLSIGMHVCVLSRVHLSVTPWSIEHQALLSMGFSQQEYWSRLLCPPPGVLPHPVIEPESPVLQIDYLLLSHCGNWHSTT